MNKNGKIEEVSCEGKFEKQILFFLLHSQRSCCKGRSMNELLLSLVFQTFQNPIYPFNNIIIQQKFERDSEGSFGDIRKKIMFRLKERHPESGITNEQSPRFVIIPYCTGKICCDIGHFVTLIVDLDYFRNGMFTPYLYVYDSSHFLCNYHGYFTDQLNKSYFSFGIDIIVDNHVLNNDKLETCHVSENLCSKIQFILNCDYYCGYYCEAVIHLLLTNKTFMNNGISTKDNSYINSGEETRLFLKSILCNKNVIKKFDDLWKLV